MPLSPALSHESLNELLFHLDGVAKKPLSTKGGKEVEKVARGASGANTGVWLMHGFLVCMLQHARLLACLACRRDAKTPRQISTARQVVGRRCACHDSSDSAQLARFA